MRKKPSKRLADIGCAKCEVNYDDNGNQGCIVTISKKKQEHVQSLSAATRGCCGTVMRTLTLADNVHGYEAKARVSTKKTEENEQHSKAPGGLDWITAVLMSAWYVSKDLF